jgi:hypothetical protein
MICKKLQQISLLLLILTSISYSNIKNLNGTLTFDEYDNLSVKRTGIISFELNNGKESKGYKVATGSFPYAHKSGKIVFKQGCGLSVINKEGFTHSVAPCPPKEAFNKEGFYEHPQLSPSGLFVAVELSDLISKSSFNFDRHKYVLVFDIKGNKIVKHDSFFAPTWLPDGRLLLSSSENRYGLFVTDKSLKNIFQIDKNRLQDYAYNPDVSPSGKRVVFEYNQQIWIMNMNGKGLKRLLRGVKRFKYPTWSPDGKYIAYLHQDSKYYYDEAIHFFEVDGTHNQFKISTRKIFEVGQTGYPDIAGPLSWISKDASNEVPNQRIRKATKMPDIKKVGYSKQTFTNLMELLAFTLGRELTEVEKIAWVKSDYTYTHGDFQNRQKKMKKVLEKFSTINSEIQNIKNENYAKLLQKYMQEYFLMSYEKAPIQTSNGMIPKLLREDNLLPINIQRKEHATVPIEFNKNSVVSDATGYSNLNVKKLKKSQWIQALSKVHDQKNLNSIKRIREFFDFIPNTKATGYIESWNNNSQSYIYYAKENPLAHWGEHIKIDQNHYKLKHNGLPITLKPWGYTFYDEIESADSLEKTTPIYLLNTTNIEKGYRDLLNYSFIFNMGFDLNPKNPSEFQKELMSHINRIRIQLDGDKTPKINFDLWFDNKRYASVFMFLLKIKAIDLKANYPHTTIDEWLLKTLKFRQEGKHIYIDQKFNENLTQEFIKRVTDEIKIYKKPSSR